MTTLILKKLHFSLLFFLLVNFLMGLFFELKFNAILIFLIKIVVYASGILLFFLSLKHLKILTLYYSLYILSPIGIIISWLADRLFGAIITTAYLTLLVPPDPIDQYDNYELRRPFSGFMSNCCSYDIIQSQFLLLERKVVQVKYSENAQNIKDFSISNDEQKAFLMYYDEYEKRDSILVIDLK